MKCVISSTHRAIQKRLGFKGPVLKAKKDQRIAHLELDVSCEFSKFNVNINKKTCQRKKKVRQDSELAKFDSERELCWTIIDRFSTIIWAETTFNSVVQAQTFNKSKSGVRVKFNKFILIFRNIYIVPLGTNDYSLSHIHTYKRTCNFRFWPLGWRNYHSLLRASCYFRLLSGNF